MIFSRAKTGTVGEKHAARFLKKRGYAVIDKNWYNKKGKRCGEIDLVCRTGDTIVFVEVKTRTAVPGQNIIPQEQITPHKLQKLQRVAELYIKEHDLWNKKWRFDAVAVYMHNHTVCDIHHIENIEKNVLEELKAQLVAEKTRLEEELSRFATKKRDGDYDTDFPADLGSEQSENAIETEEYIDNRALEQSLEAQLRDVMDALAKIENGTYGVDEETGEDIDIDRLHAYPAARGNITKK